MAGCRLLRGQIFQNIFEELQAGEGTEGILAFLDSKILTTIATAETEFTALVSGKHLCRSLFFNKVGD